MQSSVGILFLIGFLTIAGIDFSFCNGNYDAVMCRKDEKRALLNFKKDLEDPTNGLSSWKVRGDDCCTWQGVVCHNFTGHVIELKLGSSYADMFGLSLSLSLSGKINPCLQKLKHLRYLDLSGNDFKGIPFPPVIASMTQLQYVDLSNAGFMGTIPHRLGNMSRLRSLNLKTDTYGMMDVDNLQWLAGLSHLEHLDLSGVILAKAPNWLQVLNNLPFLVELRFRRCELDHFPLLLSPINFTSLAVLDLSGNNFGSLIPGWIFFSLRSLVSLDLSFCNFIGQMPEGSWNLTSLKTLDVSYNENLNSSLPNSLFTTANSLVYLSLTQCGFQGPFPPVVLNMTNLCYLDLSSNSLNSTIPSWLYSFSHLELLNLGVNKFEGGISNKIGNLTSAIWLDLSFNKLEGRLPNSIGNLASLHNLDLSYNELEGRLPISLGNLCNLKYIDLSDNKFSGELFTSSSKCTAIHALVYMFLEANQLSGHIPDQIGQFKNLSYLSLAGNLLSGPIPETLGHLSKLIQLHVSDNLLEGTVSEVHFTNLANLRGFHASGNQLTLNVSPDWIPPFQLLEIVLVSWHLGPKFPLWLRSQKGLEIIDLSCTGISDGIPTWFWNLTSSAYHLNLSYNQLHGEISYIPSNAGKVYLSSNNLNGTLPRISSNLIELDLSKNSFSGEMSHLLCDRKNEYKYMTVLLLSENFLSGEIPDCWMGWVSIKVIDIGNNNLTGNIPSSMGNLRNLQSLHLRNNHLSGEISSSLQNCTNLVVVDLSKNEFIRSIPTWMGERLSQLIVLTLRSNKLDGLIPPELCHISSLTILDLANNNLSGTIPWCFNNITSMAMKPNSSADVFYGLVCSRDGNGCPMGFVENADLVTKGNNHRYVKILTLVSSIDLSNNNISGNIPKDLTSLLGLFSLNLSGNHLIGEIPKNIGDMRSLESLDLSKNQLYGEIPPSMSDLTFLSYLNLSYNNLSGKIPLSTQLQSFNPSSFIGNKLCGLPLANNCSVDGKTPNVRNEGVNEGFGSKVDWFYLSMAFGFVVGFWGVSISILFIKSWRYAYFQFLENVWTRLCV
ncbi:hypothetical protein TEA_024267 [Camellia sinensis var. sinensis]|uniref:Leucine-rich repeat-containing N-terminal plant-type domain-containing protein n=1 Tax=Camellia sinensis var. sinensis TaxID=542762 RepID=A0A4S4E119_CAMSN|nr:hypothetical protein TEA_024267 [Camellia sinensis var. sinensis]